LGAIEVYTSPIPPTIFTFYSPKNYMINYSVLRVRAEEKACGKISLPFFTLFLLDFKGERDGGARFD
jgi:hypothetical protein